ncbi:XRE family transcriptional regulator [Desulfohalovibrio reitneri]|uniref:XRE family transcriptional regulator n=1 Tax=Desulfohalovibrio reitneri TaxID=1307759 RepID=UPI0004A723B9|nr:XRE family transcriptional regulator [Desulfohalovibrio reitneri]
MQVEGLGDRIRRVLDCSGMTRVQFCAATGVAKSTLANYLSGRRLPDAAFLAALGGRFDVNANWLLLGEGPMHRRGGDAARLSLPGGGEVIQVPALPARASGLAEAMLTGRPPFELATGFFCFNFQWLSSLGPVEDMFVTVVSGDTMEPLLRSGDMALVDGSRREPVSGRLYALLLSGAVVVKRVDLGQGRLYLYSENPAYRPIELPAEEPPLLGHVVWAGKSFLP